MSLGPLRMSEQEKLFISTDNSMFLEHLMPNANVDDACLNDSMYKSPGSPGSCRSRTRSQGSTSAESGDDLSEVYSPLQDSDASDDEKSLSSPRSVVGEVAVASCVYSVMFLLRVGAVCYGKTSICSTTSEGLGYGTEVRPEEVPFKPSHQYTRPAKKAGKAQKKSKKKAAKGPTEQVVSTASLPVAPAAPWASTRCAKASTVNEDSKVLRSARSILNKLTIEKFDSLFTQLASCGIKSEQHLSSLMHEIFEKATTQHHFIPMYAELCVRLEKDSHIVSAAEEDCLHDFRRLLLNECQKCFEQLLEPCEAASVVDEEYQMRRKQRALGNIKLLGELVVQGMLSSDMLIECANQLVKARTTCPEALESLAALIMVAGPKFDSKDWQHHSRLEELFTQMDELTKDKSTPPRVRFLLRDVLDTRGASWRTSANQAALKAAPMKLDAVREKVAEEQIATSDKCKNGLCRLAEICKRPATRKVRDAGKTKSGDADASVRTPLALKPRKQRGNPGSREIKVALKAAETLVQHDSKEDIAEKKATLVQIPALIAAEAPQFDLVAFRRSVNATLAQLSADKNVPAAVQYIRSQKVPLEFQAGQFVDILTRVVEERRGAVRRTGFAFAAGLIQGDYSPFDQQACLEGIGLFFEDVYAGMCIEVPRLPAIIRSELLPTMYAVFPIEELNEVLPEDLRA